MTTLPVLNDGAIPATVDLAGSASRAQASPGAVLRRLYLLSWALMLVNAARFLARAHFGAALGTAFVLTDYLLYTLAYVSIVMLPALLLGRLLAPRGASCPAWRRRGLAALYVLVVVALAAVQLIVCCDAIVLDMYGFHLNGFVWNLLTVRGGVESLEAGVSTQVAFALLVVATLAVQAGLFWLALRSDRVRMALQRVLPRRRAPLFVGALVVLVAFERMTYGLAYAANYRPVATQTDLFPFNVRVRMQTFAESLGLREDRSQVDMVEMGVGGSRLDYPLAPLAVAPGSPRPNVLWLVSESWRADMLDPAIMPATTAFAAGALDFRRHWSGGNGTRMGMFSMFYGLYGSYWFPFLAANRSPALLDLLIDGGWSVRARTSAKFSFPEFDETIFARFPHDRLIEGDPDLLGWENDRLNVTGMLADIDAREPGRPFFEFMFFESPHARYFFPPESVIAEPYLADMNYATMDVERDLAAIRNRYLNACRHLDSQFERIFEHLRETGLLDDTIVILTGDHGEEFLEHGKWGHHSDWSDEQSRTPLVMWIPGEAPRRIETRTSHVDIAATLAARIGVVNPTTDWCYGHDLLTAPPRSDCVVADWDHLALFTDRWKAAFPMESAKAFGTEVFDSELRPVQDTSVFWAEEQERVAGLLKDLARFTR